MKCPACGREMEPGYLQSDRPVVFTTRRPSLSGVAFPRIPRGQDLHLTNDAYSPCACPAWTRTSSTPTRRQATCTPAPC